MTTIYISGPMTGIPHYNYPAFNATARHLRAQGHRVLNPAENTPPCPNPSWHDWMRLAIAQLVQADEIYMLPGWGRSRGARIEHRLAYNLGLPARYHNNEQHP